MKIENFYSNVSVTRCRYLSICNFCAIFIYLHSNGFLNLFSIWWHQKFKFFHNIEKTYINAKICVKRLIFLIKRILCLIFSLKIFLFYLFPLITSSLLNLFKNELSLYYTKHSYEINLLGVWLKKILIKNSFNYRIPFSN